MTDVVVTQGGVDACMQESIVLAVGAEDGCAYCQAAHTLLVTKAGFTESQTIAIRRGGVDFDDKPAALLAVVRDAAANVGDVSDTTWTTAGEVSWTEREPAEAFAHLAVNLLTNYFNQFARTKLDVPGAPPRSNV